MRFLFFFFGLLLISCNSKKNSETIPELKKEQAVFNSPEITESVKKEMTFEETQDSLRTLLLNSKPNELLKSSMLEELYLRGLVDQLGDKISFNLSFNLHGLDCGASDCYSTDILFEIPATNPIVFPEKINFKFTEYGCVDEEIYINGVFELVEQSSDYVNYFSKNLKSNLIIKKGSKLYYYPHLNTNSVSVAIIDKMFENEDFEKEDAIVPYRSTVMETYDYQQFIKE